MSITINVSQNFEKMSKEIHRRTDLAIASTSIIGFFLFCSILSLFIRKTYSVGGGIFENSSLSVQTTVNNKLTVWPLAITSAVCIICVLWEYIWILARKDKVFDLAEIRNQVNTIDTEKVASQVSSSQNSEKQIERFILKLNSVTSDFKNMSNSQAIEKLHSTLIDMLSLDSGSKNFSGNSYENLQERMENFAMQCVSRDIKFSDMFSFAKENFVLTGGVYQDLHDILQTYNITKKMPVEMSLDTFLAQLLPSHQDLKNLHDNLSKFIDISSLSTEERIYNIYNSLVQNNQMWKGSTSDIFYSYENAILSSFNNTNGSCKNISLDDIDSLIKNMKELKFFDLPATMQIGVSQVDEKLGNISLMTPLTTLYNSWKATNFIEMLSSQMNQWIDTLDIKIQKVLDSRSFFNAVENIIDGVVVGTANSQISQIQKAAGKLFPLEQTIDLSSSDLDQINKIFVAVFRILNAADIRNTSDLKSNAIRKLSFFPSMVQDLQVKNLVPMISVRDFLEKYTNKTNGFVFQGADINAMNPQDFSNVNFQFNFVRSDSYINRLSLEKINLDSLSFSQLNDIKKIADSFDNFILSISQFFKNTFSHKIYLPGKYNFYRATDTISLPKTISSNYLMEIMKQRDIIHTNIKNNIGGDNNISAKIDHDLSVDNVEFSSNLKKYLSYLFAVLQCNSLIDSLYSFASLSGSKRSLVQNSSGSFDTLQLDNLSQGHLS